MTNENKEKIDITAEEYVDSYQRWVESCVWDTVKDDENWAILGLLSESGEVAQLREKYLRKQHLTEEQYKFEMTSELGDVLWNVANICNRYGISFHDVMIGNVQKIEERKKIQEVLSNKDKEVKLNQLEKLPGENINTEEDKG